MEDSFKTHSLVVCLVVSLSVRQSVSLLVGVESAAGAY